MASKWKRVVGPDGKARFVPAGEAPASAPVNQAERKADAEYCAECDKELLGLRRVRALGGAYCPACFACCRCNRSFDDNSLRYTVADGRAWCQRCVAAEEEAGRAVPGADADGHREFHDVRALSEPVRVATRVPQGGGAGAAASAPGGGADGVTRSLADLVVGGDAGPGPAAGGGAAEERCEVCGETGSAADAGLGTSGGFYHVKCFTCAMCAAPLADTDFVFHQGRPYHPACKKKATAPPCGRCGEPASGRVYTVKGERYHVGCWVCYAPGCGKSLAAGYCSADGSHFCSHDCKRAAAKAARAAAEAEAAAAPAPAPAPATDAAPAAPDSCTCGAPHAGGKFCGECGANLHELFGK